MNFLACKMSCFCLAGSQDLPTLEKFANGTVSDKPRQLLRYSARRRTTAHFTVVSTVLCTGYKVNKTVSCVLMNVILVTMIKIQLLRQVLQQTSRCPYCACGCH
jgi:hypothetical protein